MGKGLKKMYTTEFARISFQLFLFLVFMDARTENRARYF